MNAAKISANIELVRAQREHEPVLANLLELYIHDFSEFHNVAPGEDGRFGYAPLPLYWAEPNRHAFLIRAEGKLAGLVLVNGISGFSGRDSGWDLAEFFILRGWRRRGIGTAVAHGVWQRFPGPWQVRVLESNLPARHFWTHAIEKYTGAAPTPARAKRDGRWWHIFTFESAGLEA